jgi:hypothetical protein
MQYDGGTEVTLADGRLARVAHQTGAEVTVTVTEGKTVFTPQPDGSVRCSGSTTTCFTVDASTISATEEELATRAALRNRVTVLGRNAIGTVAISVDSPGIPYYLTDCCGASAKGLDCYVGCRECLQEVDPALGGLPDFDGPIIDVYGDGLRYDDWKARYLHG